jgi:amino acid transporter
MEERSTDVNLDVFTRTSSGLVRELSLVDAAWYGIGASTTLFGLIYVVPGPQAAMPGVSIPLAGLMAMVLGIFVFVLYAGLGSAMPRMGGDYLFQTRGIHPAVGFSFAIAWQMIVWVTFITLAGVVTATLGLQPLLFNLSVEWGGAWLRDLADWFGTTDGILVTALVLGTTSFVIVVRGVRLYRRVQRLFLVPTLVISNVTIIVLFARGNDAFVARFDQWHEKVLGVPDYHLVVSRAAADAGFAGTDFSFWYTALFVSTAGVLWFSIWGAQGLLGEIKHAGSFTKLLKTFCVGGLYAGLIGWVLPTFLFEQAMGRTFMHEYAAAAGSFDAPSGGNVVSLAMMMTGSPVVMILLGVGFISIGLFFSTLMFLNMTRVLTAMGMDRTLPEWFAKVDRRFHAPVNAAVAYWLLALAMALLYRFAPDVQNTVLLGGALTSVGIVAITGIAGALLPWRAPHVYEASPIARYKVGRVPLLTIAGIGSFLASGSVTTAALIVPELGFTTGWARTLILVSLVVSAVAFFAYRAFLRRVKGIDNSLAFKQVPPE